MATTFRFYDDATLLTPSTTITVVAETDLSDGPHIYTKYLGSNAANTVLQTAISPGVNPITLTPTYILPVRANSTAYAVGDSVIPSPTNGYRYEASTGGTTGASTPTWGTTLGSTTTDGGVVWTLVAEDSPITEVTLALTEADLATNTPGASLSLGNYIQSGVSNAIPIWIKEINTITNVSESIGTPELGIVINAVQETTI